MKMELFADVVPKTAENFRYNLAFRETRFQQYNAKVLTHSLQPKCVKGLKCTYCSTLCKIKKRW